jgi:hypothetical protein
VIPAAPDGLGSIGRAAWQAVWRSSENLDPEIHYALAVAAMSTGHSRPAYAVHPIHTGDMVNVARR